MKTIFTLLIIILSSNFYAQNQSMEAVFNKKKRFNDEVVLSNPNDSILMIKTRGRNKNIYAYGKTYKIKKRRKLIDNNDNVICKYSKHKIFFDKENLTVIESKVKEGWLYSIDNKEILKVNYSFLREIFCNKSFPGVFKLISRTFFPEILNCS